MTKDQENRLLSLVQELLNDEPRREDTDGNVYCACCGGWWEAGVGGVKHRPECVLVQLRQVVDEVLS
jgi:hypothetical protein